MAGFLKNFFFFATPGVEGGFGANSFNSLKLVLKEMNLLDFCCI